ncbi:hypothetical protein PIB30_069096 [Stylosanthes scabra]|uniref:Uncharacterized protein n=1 Tax=Stylosanthes scabra TaxID=79078 RepID=A0ABU6RN20_9FABA|nr:hypothetical protein [Stylosanthes scabra]
MALPLKSMPPPESSVYDEQVLPYPLLGDVYLPAHLGGTGCPTGAGRVSATTRPRLPVVVRNRSMLTGSTGIG